MRLAAELLRSLLRALCEALAYGLWPQCKPYIPTQPHCTPSITRRLTTVLHPFPLTATQVARHDFYTAATRLFSPSTSPHLIH